MNGQDLISRLSVTDTRDGLRSLGEELAVEASDAPAAMIDVWLSGAPEEADKASFVALELGDVGVRAMLRSAAMRGPTQKILLLRTAVDAQRRLTSRVLLELDAHLTDRTPMPAVDAAATPSKGGSDSPRVCDEAYLWARRLLPIDDPGRFGLRPESDYMGATSAERDAEIRAWRETHMWRSVRDSKHRGP